MIRQYIRDLKAEDEAQILLYFKQATEQAIDYKNIKEISSIFEIYKTSASSI